MKLLAPFISILAVACVGREASAIELSERGTIVLLSGAIRQGDDIVFREFLAKPRAGTLRVLRLDSGGGRIASAIGIARAVRQAGMDTLVDAATSRCQSACTMIFSGGIRRHYINAGHIADGLGKGRGLGYHGGNDMNATGRGRQAAPRATGVMIDAYYEMGTPAAAEFATKATFNQMYHISGATALSPGIATSLAAP